MSALLTGKNGQKFFVKKLPNYHLNLPNLNLEIATLVESCQMIIENKLLPLRRGYVGIVNG